MKLSFLSAAIILTAQSSWAQWEPDVRLTNDDSVSETSYSPGVHPIACNGDTAHIVWCDDRITAREIFYKRSTDGGDSWSGDMQLTFSGADTWDPAISVSGSTVHLVWTDYRDNDYEIYYKKSTDCGNTWTTDTRLSFHPGQAWNPCIAVSGSYIYVVWYERDISQNQFDLYFKRSTDNGTTWGSTVQLTTDPENSYYPSICVNGSMVHVAWYDDRINGVLEIFYKRSTDNGTTWSDDTLLSSETFASFKPSIAASGSDLHLVWRDNRDGNDEIYYKHSTDNGLNWGSDTRLTNSSGESSHGNLIANGDALYLTWIEDLNGNKEAYYKLSTNEGIDWEQDLRLTNDPNLSDRSFIAISGSGLIVIWFDNRDGNSEIYFKRDPTGKILTADFESDATSVCAGGTVQFTDLSDCNPIQWQWTFPGGTPASSTQQNPVVVYSATGTYDVTLFASNGSTSDMITKNEYIRVYPHILATPSAPEGDDELCLNSPETEYSTTGSSGASGYIWQIDPASAGVINGTGLTITIDWADTFAGIAGISVAATNICTQSSFSEPLAVTIFPLPEEYNLYGGGSFCQDSNGVEIGMENSQIGVEYELLNQGVPAGSLIMGTGSGISFGTFITSGTYTAMGRDTASWCENEMSNSVSVTLIPTPSAFQVTGGGPYCDGSNGTSINLTGSQGDHTYELYLEDHPTGMTLQGTGGAISFQDITTAGTYTIMGTENSMSCMNLMQDSAEVWVIYDPPIAPASPLGPDSVNILFTPASEYGSTGCPGAITYEWLLEPGDAGFTTPTDTLTVLVTWNPSFLGMADLFVRGINECGSGEWSDPLAIYVENTSEVDEINSPALALIYPNPNDGLFTLILNDQRKESLIIRLYNSLGHLIYSRIYEGISGNAGVRVNVKNFPEGLYFLRLENDSHNTLHKIIIKKN